MNAHINRLSHGAGAILTACLLAHLAASAAQADEVQSCSITRHWHKHQLTIHLKNGMLEEYDYVVGATQLPLTLGVNDSCAFNAKRGDSESVWATNGRTTSIAAKAAIANEEPILVTRGHNRWTFDFSGVAVLCSPSAVVATKIAVRTNSKRCELIEVLE